LSTTDQAGKRSDEDEGWTYSHITFRRLVLRFAFRIRNRFIDFAIVQGPYFKRGDPGMARGNAAKTKRSNPKAEKNKGVFVGERA
jgi:hypothetical protein